MFGTNGIDNGVCDPRLVVPLAQKYYTVILNRYNVKKELITI